MESRKKLSIDLSIIYILNMLIVYAVQQLLL